MNTSKKIAHVPKLKSTKKMIKGNKGFDSALSSLGVSVRFVQETVSKVA